MCWKKLRDYLYPDRVITRFQYNLKKKKTYLSSLSSLTDVEIKKMVVEMIISRIIHCNNNSYSASVISMKKNNGS